MRQKMYGNLSSEPVFLKGCNEDLLRSSSPDSIQQNIRTPEIDSPMPPVFATESYSHHNSSLGEPSISPVSNNFEEPGHDLVSDHDSVSSGHICRQRLTTFGSTVYHPTINGVSL